MSMSSSVSPDDAPLPGDPPGRPRATVWTWLLLLLLLAALPPAWLAIYATVKPIYEATSVLRMEPKRPGLLSASPADEPPIEEFITTQIAHMKSNGVLDRVVSNPAIHSLPLFHDASDRLETLRAALKTSRQEKTTMVNIAFEADDPQAAAMVVNEVVNSYLSRHEDFEQSKLRRERDRLENALAKLKRDFQQKVDQLKRLVDGGRVDPADTRGDGKQRVNEPEPKPKPAPVFRMGSDAYFDKLAERLADVDADLIEAEAQPNPDEAGWARIETLKGIQTALRETFTNREPKLSESDRFAVEVLKSEIEALSRMRNDLHREVEDLKRADSQHAHDLELIDTASVPATPKSDPRLAYAILSSIVLLFLLGGAALLGMDRRRGGDPTGPAGAG